MLNKIWAGLIIVGLSFAFIQDVYDNITNRYNNGQPLQLNYHVANNNGADSLSLVIDFNDQRLDASLIAEQQLRIYLGPQSPARLTQIAEIHGNKTQLNAELHRDMDRILAKAMAYDPEDRFPDCATFAKALKWYRHHHLPASGR